jgi:uncharacterized protein YjbI with pentapeptide repeats
MRIYRILFAVLIFTFIPYFSQGGENMMEIRPQGKAISIKHDRIRNSVFEDLDMSNTKFTNINMSNVSFHDINFSNVKIDAAQMGGAILTHISKRPEANGYIPLQAPLTFDMCDFRNSKFKNCDLSGVSIDSSKIEGMKINGILVTDLLKVYNSK